MWEKVAKLHVSSKTFLLFLGFDKDIKKLIGRKTNHKIKINPKKCLSLSCFISISLFILFYFLF